LNYKLVATETPIVPIWLGDEAKAEQLALAVREEGWGGRLLECPLYDVSGRSTRCARVNLNDLAHLDVLLTRMTFQSARIRPPSP
jgi:7-keto-8-aminopelargonate synthetase-like enzyme